MQTGIGEKLRLFIDGEWVDSGSDEHISVRNPATDQELALMPLASAKDVARAVESGAAAAPGWWEIGPSGRAVAIMKFAKLLEAASEELAQMDAENCGNPIDACRDDLKKAVTNCRYRAAHVTDVKGETTPVAPPGLSISLREPYGVSAYIVPFNHPVNFAAGAIGPLSVGNTVIVKPAHQTPLSALRMAELASECFPPGVFNVVTGAAETGLAIAEHPDVRLIVFIGGVPAGLSVLRAGATGSLKKTVLELGGKNPIVICDDANVPAATAAAVTSMNFDRCQGQSCGSTSRVLVHSSIAAEVVDALEAAISTIKLVNPVEEKAGMGPLISKTHQLRVAGFVDGARAAGARVVLGGSVPTVSGFEDGAFYLPTLLAGVTPDMQVAKEEVFGPVITVLTWDTDEEAIAIANSVSYGLTSCVWTRDIARAQWFIAKLQAGRVFVNAGIGHAPGAAYGAYKNSGLGVTGGTAEMLEYTQTKLVTFAGV